MRPRTQELRIGHAVRAQRAALAARDVHASRDLVERHVLGRQVAGNRAHGLRERASCTPSRRSTPELIQSCLPSGEKPTSCARSSAGKVRRRRGRRGRETSTSASRGALVPREVTTRAPSARSRCGARPSRLDAPGDPRARHVDRDHLARDVVADVGVRPAVAGGVAGPREALEPRRTFSVLTSSTVIVPDCSLSTSAARRRSTASIPCGWSGTASERTTFASGRRTTSTRSSLSEVTSASVFAAADRLRVPPPAGRERRVPRRRRSGALGGPWP